MINFDSGLKLLMFNYVINKLHQKERISQFFLASNRSRLQTRSAFEADFSNDDCLPPCYFEKSIRPETRLQLTQCHALLTILFDNEKGGSAKETTKKAIRDICREVSP